MSFDTYLKEALNKGNVEFVKFKIEKMIDNIGIDVYKIVTDKKSNEVAVFSNKAGKHFDMEEEKFYNSVPSNIDGIDIYFHSKPAYIEYIHQKEKDNEQIYRIS